MLEGVEIGVVGSGSIEVFGGYDVVGSFRLGTIDVLDGMDMEVAIDMLHGNVDGGSRNSRHGVKIGQSDKNEMEVNLSGGGGGDACAEFGFQNTSTKRSLSAGRNALLREKGHFVMAF